MERQQPIQLHLRLLAAFHAYATRVALVEPACDTQKTYSQLAALVDDACQAMAAAGVVAGDRVGVCLPKSIDAVVVAIAAMVLGAAYVPVDPQAPMARGAYILEDCQVRLVFCLDEVAPELSEALSNHSPAIVALTHVGGSAGLSEALSGLPRQAVQPAQGSSDDLAYILYTSGSTGTPKGVMLSHENACSFIDWATELCQPTPDDRFSSHAPLHFDLSILDLYTCLTAGATLVLVEPKISRAPRLLARWIAEHQISVWYSAPSILSMLAQYGRLDRLSFPELRTVLFAGEVFPIGNLRRLRELWSHPRFFNLYGPTETNVCTAFEIPGEIDPERTNAFPIGVACSHVQVRVVAGEPPRAVARGCEGELQVHGPAVTRGYWNLPERTQQAFTEDGWYRTGDIVVEDDDGQLVFVGRRDRMVKRRGYRVELGEIEAALYQHPDVEDVAVVAEVTLEAGARIVAFLVARGEELVSEIDLRVFCSRLIPAYMIPDAFEYVAAMPMTSTDKVDYQALKRAVSKMS